VTKIRCNNQPCTGLAIYFLPEAQYLNLEDGRPFVPDAGSWTNVSHALTSYNVHTVVSGRDEKYYVVLLNEGEELMQINVEITFQVADCLLFLASLLFIPVTLLGICFCLCRGEGRKQQPGSPKDDFDSELCCCEYDIAKDPGPSEPSECCTPACCTLPKWDWCCGFPLDFWKRPTVSYTRWWRSQVLLTWPWNPEEDEGLTAVGARQTFVLTTLLFNLLVLTLWSEVLLQLNSSVSRVMPVLGSYFSRYVGSTAFTYLFYIVFKPILTFLFVSGPEWQQSQSACKRFFGLILTYGLEIVLLLLLAAVAYSTLLLFTQYRCSVLLSGLIIPFFCYEVLKMLLVFGFIPLPLWYWLLLTFGPSVDPQAEEEREPLRGEKRSRRSEPAVEKTRLV
jgi:hypothetical protein